MLTKIRQNMVFFSLHNPLALFFTLVIVIVLIKYSLGKIKWFQKHDEYRTPIIIMITLIVLLFYPILKLFALAIPILMLIFLFLILLAGVFLVLGVKEENLYKFMSASSFLKTLVFILIVVAVLFSGSQVWGEQLLKEKSVSLTDPLTPQAPPKEINMAPLFTKQTAGLGMLVIVIGSVFWWVRSS